MIFYQKKELFLKAQRSRASSELED